MRAYASALAAEGLGTAFLLAVIVGSGIVGDQLAGRNVAIALLASSLATGFGLAALILAFASSSGAHFNPAVTLIAASRKEVAWRIVPTYVLAQVIGAVLGVAAAHAMFGHSLFALSEHVRTGPAQWWSETGATFGLVLIIARCGRHGVPTIAASNRSLHRCRILVLGIDFLREPCGNVCPGAHRHIFRDPAGRCASVRLRPASGRDDGRMGGALARCRVPVAGETTLRGLFG